MHTAYIGLGSNLPSSSGTPAETLAAAVLKIAEHGEVGARSSLYRTNPLGFAAQPRFVNAVVELRTGLDPRALIKKLLDIEKQFGRNRSQGIPNGPRTLDLDILLMDDLKICEPGLELPHPRLTERAFVLIPLGEIAPRLPIPGQRKMVAELVEELRGRSEDEANAVVRMESELWLPSRRP